MDHSTTDQPLASKAPYFGQGILRRALSNRTLISQATVFATDFEILHGIIATPAQPCAVQPRQKPRRIAVLLNEEQFLHDHALHHGRSVWLEDRVHDWEFKNGALFYYGHATTPGHTANLVAIYQEGPRPRAPLHHA